MRQSCPCPLVELGGIWQRCYSLCKDGTIHRFNSANWGQVDASGHVNTSSVYKPYVCAMQCQRNLHNYSQKLHTSSVYKPHVYAMMCKLVRHNLLYKPYAYAMKIVSTQLMMTNPVRILMTFSLYFSWDQLLTFNVIPSKLTFNVIFPFNSL